MLTDVSWCDGLLRRHFSGYYLAERSSHRRSNVPISTWFLETRGKRRVLYDLCVLEVFMPLVHD